MWDENGCMMVSQIFRGKKGTDGNILLWFFLYKETFSSNHTVDILQFYVILILISTFENKAMWNGKSIWEDYFLGRKNGTTWVIKLYVNWGWMWFHFLSLTVNDNFLYLFVIFRKEVSKHCVILCEISSITGIWHERDFTI